MPELLRKLYILKPAVLGIDMTPQDDLKFSTLRSSLSWLKPLIVYPEELLFVAPQKAAKRWKKKGAELPIEKTKQSVSLEGSVLLIPSAHWSPDLLSDLTRFADLSIVAMIGCNDGAERVGLWYALGAILVLDETVSTPVLSAALAKLMEVEASKISPDLTRKETLLFEILRRAGPVGVDRSDLAERVWNNVFVHNKTFDVHIFNLRTKLNSTRYQVVCEGRRYVLVEGARPRRK